MSRMSYEFKEMPKRSTSKSGPSSNELSFGAHIEGAEALANMLKSLGPRIEKNALISAMRKGAGIIRDEARHRAPAGPTKNLRKRIKTEKPKVSKFANPQIIVKSSAPHSHLVEYGTKDRYRKAVTSSRSGGSVAGYTGKVEKDAHAFMRPAFEAKKKTAIAAVTKQIRTYVARHLVKGYAKAYRTG